jgi:hypothetical protein
MSISVPRGVEVAITFLEQYYANHEVVVKAASHDALLFKVLVLEVSKEVSDAIEIPMLYQDGDIQQISECVLSDNVWEVQYLKPYVDVNDTTVVGISYRARDLMEDIKLVIQYLTLEVDMKVNLYLTNYGQKKVQK